MISAYLLDLDGTLYSGGAAVPGAVELLGRLRAAGTPFRLVTNTTSRSRAMLVERLRGYGFQVEPHEIFTATLAGVAVARAAGHRVVAPFLAEAALADLTGLQLGGTPDAIMVGDLGERWSYRLLQEAFEHLMNGADFIALSRDRYWLKDDRLALDAGPFVAALEYASGKAATVAGKPSPTFYAAAVASMGLEGRGPEVAMVGDDLWSDVQGAQQAGLEGWLVRTGKFRQAALQASGVVPNRILDSVAGLE